MHKSLKINILIGIILLSALHAAGQMPLPLDSILTRIETLHPRLKGTDARIRELDTYAKGALTMPAPQIGGGF